MFELLIIFSAMLFFIGLFLYLLYPINSKFFRILLCFEIFYSLLFFVLYLVANFFTGEGINEAVIYFFKYGLSNAGFSEFLPLIIMSLSMILLFLISSFGLFFWRKEIKSKNSFLSNLSLVLLLFSLACNPVTSAFDDLFYDTYDTYDIEQYNLYKEYGVPSLEKIDEEKNFVYIYAEGFELTYFNETLFPGLITHLREFEGTSISFTNITQDRYSHHTTAGVVASQCGIPLISPSHGNTMSGMDKFLVSAICFGDLLDKKGYYLSYYGGASLGFGGKGKFFSTHGFDEVKGRDELYPLIVKKYHSGWGLYDDSLFDLAYERFIKLSKKENKFGLFLLTLDTHHPYGHPSKSCDNITYGDGKNSMLNAVACSDYLIANFINKIKASEHNDVVIVLASDHLGMQNTAVDLLKKADRKNLFLINLPNNSTSEKITSPGLTLDISTTLLPFIGYQGNIGLGKDLINSERNSSRVNNIKKNITDFKPYITQLWNFPKIKKQVVINPSDWTINIDYRTFNLPIMIEFDNELRTKLYFEFSINAKNLMFNSLYSKFDNSTSLMIVQTCSRMGEIVSNPNSQGLCLLIGNKTHYNLTGLSSMKILSKDEIIELARITNSLN